MRGAGVRTPNNGGRKIIGKFPSVKQGKPVWFESQLERDYLYFLEVDPEVTAYSEQPLRLTFTLEAKKRVYTPDFLVERGAEKQIVEVKPFAKASKEANVILYRTAREILARRGYGFAVVTERSIRREPRLQNLKLLFRFAKSPITLQDQLAVHALFSGTDSVPLSEIVRCLGDDGRAKATTYALLYHGVLVCDFDERLGFDRLVHFTGLHPNLPEGASPWAVSP